MNELKVAAWGWLVPENDYCVAADGGWRLADHGSMDEIHSRFAIQIGIGITSESRTRDPDLDHVA